VRWPETARPVDGVILRSAQRGDRIMQSVIVGSGLSVLLLLAWVHLGLGALMTAPKTAPLPVAAAAGPYVVTLSADSGPLVIGDDNPVSFDVVDRQGRPMAGASLRVHADMTTMAMPVPDVTATAKGGGRYGALLLFSMAGTWRLDVAVVVAGHASAHVAFTVDVRWR
jgi:YtkA-like protein